jgi:hypothetical protein
VDQRKVNSELFEWGFALGLPPKTIPPSVLLVQVASGVTAPSPAPVAGTPKGGDFEIRRLSGILQVGVYARPFGSLLVS